MSEDVEETASAAREAAELAQQVWDDILVIFNGPGTFTSEQTDGYAMARIASALAEVIHQRNASIFHIGEVWMQRNQAVRERDEARRVARVLAEATAENLTPKEIEAREAAETYPEAE